MSIAYYFDGHSSARRPCALELIADNLVFTDPQSLEIIDEWSLGDVKIERFRSQRVLDLSHQGSLARVTVNGVEADDLYQILLPNQTPINQLYQHVLAQSAAKIVFIGLLAMLGVIICYLAIIAPTVARLATNLLPIETEISLGDQIKKQIIEPLKVDSSKSIQLQTFFDLTGFDSKYPIQLYLAEDNVTNAFAIPGGHIVIYQNMIDVTNSWQELAALMAHELAHINQRHSVKALARNLSTYLLISVLTGDIGGVSSLILENASRLSHLSHSRSAEKDADLTGLSYLSQNHIPTKSMANLFENIFQDSDDQSLTSKIPELLSTHPVGPNRLAYLKELVEESDTVIQHEAQGRLATLWESLRQID